MTSSTIALRFEVPEAPEPWVIEEEYAPDMPPHDAIVEPINPALKPWVRTVSRPALVASYLAGR